MPEFILVILAAFVDHDVRFLSSVHTGDLAGGWLARQVFICEEIMLELIDNGFGHIVEIIPCVVNGIRLHHRDDLIVGFAFVDQP